ncbi:hypothetical protein DL89DRAFT_266546 [Linderina pennispora]|uniref:Uncharacterized protein n=1 Tax=Linderina pennispora TaxID=61395 RepID=A0A1Y1WEF1_9FUNG|nr:uncharacterized protein DL89DRAFT_266546 [Linderina pennispora]ORX71544.1 hypothetical protein DL89DRAFT_266546 [Linderina pennispora]
MPRATRSSTRGKAAPATSISPKTRTREARTLRQPTEAPADISSDSEPSRMRTRQKANPARKRALQRLMQAIRDGGGSDSEPVRRALTRTRRSSRRTRQEAEDEEVHSSDSDYVMAGDVEDAEEDRLLEEQAAGDEFDLTTDVGRQAAAAAAAAAAEQKHERRRTEKKLILKIKKTSLLGGKEERRGARKGGRREALRKRKMGEAVAGNADGEITTAKLKKSSLAPAPLQLERVKHAAVEKSSESIPEETVTEEVIAEDIVAEKAVSEKPAADAPAEEAIPKEELSTSAANEAPVEEEVLIAVAAEAPAEKLPAAETSSSEDEEMVDVSAEPVIGDAMEIDNDADSHHEVPQTPGASLQLPPRAVAMNPNGRASGYELQHEDKLLKDLYAEVADQLRKLQTEERLLRMIVKKDFELPEEAVADDAAMFSMDPAYSSFLDTEHHAPTGGELEMHDGEESSDGEGSSSESDGIDQRHDSSDEEVQDEDIARASLGRILTDYVPTNGWPSTA